MNFVKSYRGGRGDEAHWIPEHVYQNWTIQWAVSDSYESEHDKIDAMDLIGVQGTADNLLRLGDTFGGLILWSVKPGGKFVLRCVEVLKEKPAKYKTVDLDFLRKSGDRRQNWCGPVVGEL